jgi:hypothetical protein
MERFCIEAAQTLMPNHPSPEVLLQSTGSATRKHCNSITLKGQ